MQWERLNALGIDTDVEAMRIKSIGTIRELFLQEGKKVIVRELRELSRIDRGDIPWKGCYARIRFHCNL